MAYFIWADDMTVDNGQLDQDHQYLVDKVNQLHTATEAGRGQEIAAQVLEDLISSTLEHVRREEQLMIQIKYPRLQEHQADHAVFIDGLRALQGKCAAGSITVAAQLSTLLRDWLSVHIRRYDKDIFHFMQQQRRAKTSA